MSSGGPSTEESSLSSLALPILGAELICEGGVLVAFFEFDVVQTYESSQKWIWYIELSDRANSCGYSSG